MEIQIAVAKINKYDAPEGGDTLEIVERPNGGVSVVLADGQASSREARIISTFVVRRVIGLLAEGVRDGAAARAASDSLFTEGEGRETAYLNILSADLETDTIVISRNSPSPVFIAQREQIECLDSESPAIGGARNIRPVISEIPLEQGTSVVIYTDGLANAGSHMDQSIDVCTLLESLLEDQEPVAQEIADTILSEAIRLENNRPNDDMSIVVLRVHPREADPVRRMTVRLPVTGEKNQEYEKI